MPQSAVHAPVHPSAPAATPGRALYLETYGCQMNVLDSQLVSGELAALGYRQVDSAEQADVVLLNTCSVRALAEQKVWSKLGRLRAQKETQPALIIGVLGCMAERLGHEIVDRMPHVDVICGPSNLDALPQLLDNAFLQKLPQFALAGHTSRRSAVLHSRDGLEALDLSRLHMPIAGNGAQAYVRITRGCNKFCSFCVVPYTRGPEIHRPPLHIVEEIKQLVDKGALEVTLLGQTINHYHYKDASGQTSFADLLALIHERVPALPRLRFVTSYPRDFTDAALDVMAASPRICRYLHLPAQSGSNRLLRSMNRGYEIEEYLALLERARARMPDISLAGDMIVGFPDETQADHAASVQFLKQARYKSCFIFKYSPRSGTVAARRLQDNVPEDVKRARNIALLEVQAQISQAHHRQRVGSVMQVLIEGENPKAQLAEDLPSAAAQTSRGLALLPEQPPQPAADPQLTRLIGRTMGDEMVVVQGPAHLIGSLVPVRITQSSTLTLQGQLAS